MPENRNPWDTSAAYPGAPYTHGVEVSSSGPPVPRLGQDLQAEQQAVRDLELATTSSDARGIGPLSAGPTALLMAVLSVLLLWVLGGLPGFFLAVVTGALTLVYGLRAVRSAHHERTRPWWLGTTAMALAVVSLVGCFVLNVVAPDKGGTSQGCLFTGTCGVLGGK
ncbi:MAG TPA: hypothetical protein VFL59_03460 [Candidatus Nanopelagicales bacterium]|nr:hypothetical protein [Candidatus Nanopelagicales bacterium]